jgi:hypothetical protein
MRRMGDTGKTTHILETRGRGGSAQQEDQGWKEKYTPARGEKAGRQ